MAGWKDFTSDAEKKRAAAFEAAALAELAKHSPVTPAPPPPPQSAAPVADGIQIVVTTNGQTQTYREPSAVPAIIREKLLAHWQPVRPPPLPELPTGPGKNGYRIAFALNLCLPGAGQFYLGRRAAGVAFALPFLICFGALTVIFSKAVMLSIALSTDGTILEAGKLEQLSAALPAGWIIGLLGAAVGIFFAGAIHLSRHRAR